MAQKLPCPDFVHTLLTWYDNNRRDLPWRRASGDPYKTWIAEVMLQQTTTQAVLAYYNRFIQRWSTVTALAEAHLDEVLCLWSGLGYYARARRLHQCARYIVYERKGVFPKTSEELRRLPGIGRYTASMLAAVCFGEPVAVIDTNIERILVRCFAITQAKIPRSLLYDAITPLVPKNRPADFAQAFMDLGALICMSQNPKCLHCPVSSWCVGYQLGLSRSLPYKVKKEKKPIRRGIVYWLSNGQGDVWLRRRLESGLLGGMMEFPSTPWKTGSFPDQKTIIQAAPVQTVWQRREGIVRHSFTHFSLELGVMTGSSTECVGSDGFWCARERLYDYALPTVMHKVIKHVKGTSVGQKLE